MKLSVSNGNYDVLESNSVILFTPNSELSLHINATSDFSFAIILSFMDADKQEIKKETRDEKTLIFKFLGFNNALGAGSAAPISIATVDGKAWYLHVWTYLMGTGSNKVRKVEYTICQEKQVTQ